MKPDEGGGYTWDGQGGYCISNGDPDNPYVIIYDTHHTDERIVKVARDDLVRFLHALMAAAKDAGMI